ncbi:MAG: Gfo/Idh/MocA family oxidoreductase [Meiothermus sp.]|uniref:Gfo/Idh/MocA family protein n=1 Tax=Meiothermus sp. TaxID=1955249 RepID=UPI0025F4CD00|nr:Gfo/Idh/MocA family oxidoreductase [Meiothermus sp.]MCS7068637.1 Gfo/Idh/MocA family oxidoreductase [Meiothermus sp.]MDW8424618.1 Gfo/Idh/MocA family oxidoreductase [Meiothermus sp.]
MNQLKVVLVGLGTRGRHWARVIAENPRARLIAGVEPSVDSVSILREKLPTLDFPVLALDEALALQPDLVVLSTPPAVHLEQIAACAERGLPVLCEKPLALDFGTARTCVEVAEKAGILLGIGMNFRYLETTRASREIIQGGRLGQIGFGRINYWRHRDGRRPLLNKYPLTMEQPMLLEQSIHHLDLARFIYGAEVKKLWARTTNPPWSMYRSDATVAAWLEFENGFELQYFGTWMGTPGKNEFQWRTDGSAGMLFQRDLFRGLEFWRAGATEPEEIELTPQEDFIDDTRGLFDDFLKAVCGEPSTYPSGRDHLKTMLLTLGCAESSRQERMLDLRAYGRQLGVEF